MAGSYNHCVKDDGSLRTPEDMGRMLENGGDAYEAVEEMYGMIWFLADQLDHLLRREPTAALVEEARKNYKFGIELSPTGRPALY